MFKKAIKEVAILTSAIVNTIFYNLSGFSKRKTNRVILGSWSGHKIADNSRFFLEYIKDNDDYEIIWCGRKHLRDSPILDHPNINFVQYNTPKCLYYSLTSSYAFICNTYRDISTLNLLKGATIVQLWHGFGLKNTLASKKMSPASKFYYLLGSGSFEQYHYFISSSDLNTQKMLYTFQNNGITAERIILSGQPKNDFLLTKNTEQFKQSLKHKYFFKYNIPQDKKIVLYLPTFREQKTFSFGDIDHRCKQNLQKILSSNDTIIIEKKHFKDKCKKNNQSNNQFTYIIDSDEETQELLLISDMLITDYSSCYLEYLLLDRPIIHFAYDFDMYKNSDRGFFFSLEQLAAGPITRNLAETLDAIDEQLKEDSYKVQRQQIKQKAMMYDEGKSCQKIINTILKNAHIQYKLKSQQGNYQSTKG
ncbi:CDP-glycerol glycerophosphotransferase family protein [Proteinivorax tanatarense]|uniref:CDP-glycerol glycerophosphotransferase family protein n=1 Tax=Proteinivorax tanatarense TaxID=1260629 RepID=A0AAU7VHS4_9FIRM